MRAKLNKQREHKEALDVQVRTKPTEVPRAFADSEVFGDLDAKSEHQLAMKRKEIETQNYHMALVEQRKREQLLQEAREQQADAEIVEQALQE